MKLRARLVLSTVVLMLPLSVVVVWTENGMRERMASDVLAADALAVLEGTTRDECEASPMAWTRSRIVPHDGPPSHEGPPPHDPLGPPPNRGASAPIPLRVHLFPYDATLEPSFEPAPLVDHEVLKEARDGALRSRRHVDVNSHEQMLLRSPWGTGPCAYFLAMRPTTTTAIDPLVAARGWVAPIVALVLAILLTVGPIVARVRALAASVRTSARHRYRDRILVTGNDELTELAAAFDEAAREVRQHVTAQEQREQALRDFLANTTHDVMTPLTVLQGHLASVRDALREGSAVDRATVDAAIDEASYMISIINNLGVAARLEAGEPHIVRAPVDVGRLVERCISRHRPIAGQHGIELDCSVPEQSMVVVGDETFLEQAVGNLTFNAIVHNRPGGHAAVVVTDLEGSRVRIRVIDDGPALSDEDLARISDPSSTIAAARTRRRDGHGLGLAITRRVCEAHGMTLTFSRLSPSGLQVDIEGPVG